MTESPYWTALRTELVAHVSSDKSRSVRRRRRWFTGGFAAFALLGGTGTAFATGLIPLPGAEHVTAMGEPTTVMGTGTTSIELGPRPNDSLGVDITVLCLTEGSFSFADGAGGACSPSDAGQSVVSYYVRLPAGQHVTTITASPGFRWRATVQYSRHDVTQFAVNARGQTYGVMTTDGRVPDLIAVQGADGQQGYVYATELSSSEAQGGTAADGHVSVMPSIPMYKSDGVTVIGEFAPAG